MRYNLAEPAEATGAKKYLDLLIERGNEAEVKKVSPARSLNQNNYLHLLLAAFGQHFGYTLDEAKLIYKEINKATYQYDKKGRKFFRSSADLSTEEMTTTIDRFREKSAEEGCPLPLATDQGWLRSIENEMERSGGRYL